MTNITLPRAKWHYTAGPNGLMLKKRGSAFLARRVREMSGKTKRKVPHGTPISNLLEGDEERRPVIEKKRKPKKQNQRPGKNKTVRRDRRPSSGGGRR
jgi:hypothetical protein